MVVKDQYNTSLRLLSPFQPLIFGEIDEAVEAWGTFWRRHHRGGPVRAEELAQKEA
jgi:hypothetical protein